MIKIQGLSKSFGSFYALRDLSLEIHPGEYWMIVGPNGAGKTTLLKIIATLSQPTTGKIVIDEIKSEANRIHIRKQIGFIGHQSFLYENLTAEENLKFYARMYRLENIENRIANTLAQVGLTERKSDLVRTFSRGMQQRLSIGRALLADPTIILLDEPFSGLDQSAIENFVDLFTSLISPDRMIIMTTHDLHLGLQLATHFAVITRGKLVQQGLTNLYTLDGFKSLYRKLTGEGH
ncbi:MAG: heme ABC exporter ATP-binding protein CcmA [bacterium]|nr:heme ABC exporter ATP-binding protein CcmA [bacterium]